MSGKILMVILCSSLSAVCGADTAPRPDGETIFSDNCAVCHGQHGQGLAAIKTPNFTDPKIQASITDEQILATVKRGRPGTVMPSWSGKLSSQEMLLVAAYIRSLAKVEVASAEGEKGKIGSAEKGSFYQPGDDSLISLPSGRPTDRHGFYLNFAHRFPYDPAFSGTARGGSLLGLDGFALPSFGLRYGVTDRFSVGVYRSPTFIARPIQLMVAYSFAAEKDGMPFNATARFSVEGQDNFRKNHTENIELILSRSITNRAQVYAVPTVSLQDRRLFFPSSYRSSDIPSIPGYNAFSTGFGAAVDVRPTVALLAEAIPTFVNGRPLGIHRPAFGFGIQKKIWRHSFTLGFTNSPGTTVSQRAGTRAAFIGDPSADTFKGLTIGFDLTRQIR